MVVTLVVAGVIGARIGLTNTSLLVASLGLLALFGGVPLLIYLLDAQLARRVPGIQNSRSFAGLVGALRWLSSLAFPQRLVLPVQLTLQSNTRPVLFFIGLVVAMFAILTIGNFQVIAWRDFTVSNEFVYLDDEAVEGSFRSVYYEDMPSPMNRHRPWPRIPSFTQAGSHLRLFLPYHPIRDNLMLDRLCTETEAEASPVTCLRRLWSVSLNGQLQPLDGFVAAERGDLSMRGLIGLVPVGQLTPGMHTLTVVWNPSAAGTSAAVDDRYDRASSEFDIPFALIPGVEQGLE